MDSYASIAAEPTFQSFEFAIDSICSESASFFTTMDDVQVVQLKDLGIAEAVEANDDIVRPILTKIVPESTNSFEFAIDNICSESASFFTTMDDVLVGQLKDLGIAKAVEANDGIVWPILTKTFPESAKFNRIRY